MAVKWSTVKAGDLLWDCHMEKMGNTTMSQMGAWKVMIVAIDHEHGVARAWWNDPCNGVEDMYKAQVEKLRRKPAKRRDGTCSNCGLLRSGTINRICTCAERR